MGWKDLFKPWTFPGNAKKFLTEESAADKEKRENLNNQGGMSSWFADQGQDNYGRMTAEGDAHRASLARLASGQDSYSKEQLRQGLQQQYGQQRSMAAGASSNNQAMAARTAAMGMGRASTAMSGQAALAGIQERRAASEQLGGAIRDARGQDVNVALGSRQNATTAYGAGKDEKGWVEKNGPAITALGAVGAKAFSDERVKTNVSPGNAKANQVMDGLKAYSYRYKDQKNGAGPQLGVMAQDLERAGLKQAVQDTPSGKVVDGAKLAGANTAMLASLSDRLAELEKKKGR